MVKYDQTIRRQFADELFECVDHFARLAFEGLRIVFYLRHYGALRTKIDMSHPLSIKILLVIVFVTRTKFPYF